MIIAIDGPAGAGKSTVAKLIAKRLGFTYIDTGAMYRALALRALQKKIHPQDEKRLIEMARRVRVDLVNKNDGSLQVLLDGVNVSKAIRHPRITRIVSEIAKIKGIRKLMVKLQRKLGTGNGVWEGRDIGTVVFPDADKKFYLDAKFPERVKRRYEELRRSNLKSITPKIVWQDLRNRDIIDSTRSCAPLKKAKDAIYIDTTNMSIEGVVNKVLKNISTNSVESV